ncbi:MAG: hypothetical protein KDD89_03195, partial [Anaerolineales bacterium]|nr:hypothetical protein [Anaerolineales bacterium]
MGLTLEHIVAALAGDRPDVSGGVGSTAVSNIVIDSRQATAASLFVAFKGEQVDGHDYVAEAFQNGATTAVVERPVGDYPLIDCRTPHTQPVTLPTRPFLLQVENSEAGLQQIARYWRQQFPALRAIGVTGSVGKTTTKEVIH